VRFARFSAFLKVLLPCAKNWQLQFIEQGKPIQNAFIESFNSRLREECLLSRA
jgi:hypothetical protein